MFFNYEFKFENGEKTKIVIELKKEDLNIVNLVFDEKKECNELKNFKCPNCKLQGNKECPVLKNLLVIVEEFKTKHSYDKCEIKVETRERVYIKYDSLQSGIGSLMGIIMVSSGCPTLEKLKPMVKFHLPFATIEETMYRAASMYLMAQYIRNKDGKIAKYDLREIADIYAEIEKINVHMARQLNKINICDASINAIVLLNSFASFANITFGDEFEKMMKSYFKVYLDN